MGQLDELYFGCKNVLRQRNFELDSTTQKYLKMMTLYTTLY